MLLGNHPEVIDMDNQTLKLVLKVVDIRRSRIIKKLIESGPENQVLLLGEKRASLTGKLLMNSSIIDDLLYSEKNFQIGGVES